MVDPEEVRRQLEAALPGARIEVANPAGDGEHLEVRVATAAFAGLGLVEQHRMVYAALGDLMPRIHALQLRTDRKSTRLNSSHVEISYAVFCLKKKKKIKKAKVKQEKKIKHDIKM